MLLESPRTNRLVGALIIGVIFLVVLREWHVGRPGVDLVLPGVMIAIAALLGLQVPPGRKVFVLLAMALTVAAAITLPHWTEVVMRGLGTAGFIVAFFSALATLRNAADTAPEVRRAGAFLAGQPPGRRYLALTAGGHLFALLLNYGAIALLGSLSMANVHREPNAEIRRIRTRRMLLAVQRGFVSTLPWSPLSMAMAISPVLIPGSSWAAGVAPGLVNAALIAGTGWALDSLFKPRPSLITGPPVRPEGSWATLLPLLALLALLATVVLGLFAVTGVRVPGLVITLVPLAAAAWIALQNRRGAPLWTLARRARQYAFVELPAYRGEIVLLMMAGYIGTIGAALAEPALAFFGLGTPDLPGWVVLVGLVWLIPLAGQVGMNPILAVSLIAPLLPTPEALGLSPTSILVAVLAGWGLSGTSSPFTASTLLIANFAGVSARRVGLVWNGPFTLVAGSLLSAWVLIFTYVL